MIVITIPLLAPSLNGDKGLMRMHFQAYKKVRDKWQVLIMEETRKRITEPVRVQIIRYYASQPLDLDNLYAACKVPLDALRKTKVIIEDNPDIIVDLNCKQVKVGTRAEQKTTIIIMPYIK